MATEEQKEQASKIITDAVNYSNDIIAGTTILKHGNIYSQPLLLSIRMVMVERLGAIFGKTVDIKQKQVYDMIVSKPTEILIDAGKDILVSTLERTLRLPGIGNVADLGTSSKDLFTLGWECFDYFDKSE